MNFEKTNVTIKIAKIRGSRGSKIPIITPSIVATPLPPLKPTYIGNACPITAITPRTNL